MSRRTFWKSLAAVAAFIGIGLAAFFGGTSPSHAQGREEAFERVKEVQERHTAKLLATKGVVGTAIGLDLADRPAVKVYLETPDVPDIPEELEGVPVEVEVTGKLMALPKPDDNPDASHKPPSDRIDPTDRFPRPVPIGVSTGNMGECSSGTIGARVTAGGSVFALSNNHVFALENDAPLGSNLLQPGSYDTRCIANPDDCIGTLAVFEDIVMATDANNVVDAAIAISSPAFLSNATPSDGYGVPQSATVPAFVGQAVQKYGRTTSLTRGSVSGINATVHVTYTAGTARFVGQIIVSSSKRSGGFIKPGDSGSLLVTDPGKNPVGLLFAGNSSGSMAIANPIDYVLTRLGVTIDGL
jgi:hypothetical protein